MTLSFDEWKKVELLTGVVKEASRVEGSDKLLSLTIDIGVSTRHIVSGIGKSYAPESLIGRTIILLANLEPRAIMGQMSEGMLLAAKDTHGTLSLLTTDSSILPGSHVS